MNTFHADYRLLRWSLDHIFHSTDFGLVEMKRLSHIGSDHFPIYVVLQTGRIFEQQQEELEQSAEDERDVGLQGGETSHQGTNARSGRHDRRSDQGSGLGD
jgi:hypothetical protein